MNKQVEEFREVVKRITQGDLSQMMDYLWRNPADIVNIQRIASQFMTAGDTPESREIFLEAGRIMAGVYMYDKPDRWRGLSLKHVQQRDRFLLVAHLSPGAKYLTQEIVNFLTLADVPAAKHWLKTSHSIVERAQSGEFTETQLIEETIKNMTIEPEQVGLANAFMRQMIEEAAPFRHKVIQGVFEMDRVPFERVDALITYQKIRLVFTPTGFFISFINNQSYSVYWWSPEGHTMWGTYAHTVWALNVLCACIWRDACVVRHQFAVDRARAEYTPRSGKKYKHNNPLVLPRIIREVAWSTDEERERIVHRTHAVRAHYRELSDGRSVSQAAIDNAEQYGFPVPPEGYTFVTPHIRGGGDAVPDAAVQRVVCKGLQVARIALGR